MSADLSEFEGYLGADAVPDDFEAFWAARMAEADAVPMRWHVESADVATTDSCEFFDLWFYGMHGAKLYAKYVRPCIAGALPLVLQFHGYPGASRSWFEQSSFAGMGCALIAMDNPGQGGRSEDVGGFLGTTVAGHLVAGADGPIEDLYYVRLYQDVRILCRIVEAMGEQGAFDLSRVFVNGASQGGAMGIACCALNPSLVSRAAILYPFLSDFRRVSQLDADEVAYEGLRYWSRWFDPDGSRADALFSKLAYFDTKNFAHMVRCPVLFGTGLADTVCPPETQCAVYNNLACKKTRRLYPGMGHEEIQSFDDEILDFFGEALSCAGDDRGAEEKKAEGDPVRLLADAVLPLGHSSVLDVTPRDGLCLGNARAHYHELGIPGADGATFLARYVCPVSSGSHPLVLLFSDLGRGVRGWHYLTRYIAAGFAVLHPQNHAAVGDGADPACLEMACQDALAAYDVASVLCDVDAGGIVVSGEGFGAVLALRVAARRDASAVIALNPYPTNMVIDDAHEVRCPTLLGSSGLDERAPLREQADLAARVPHLSWRRYPKYAHERINAFEDESLRFVCGLSHSSLGTAKTMSDASAVP